MSELIVIILLGIVEGITEFLPVSSTGHLVLAGSLLGFNSEVSGTFEIVIQLGAILSVIVLYWRRFWNVLEGLLRRDSGAIAFTRNVLLAFLPSAVIGLFVYSAIKALLTSPQLGPIVVSIALIVGGVIILLMERLIPHPPEGSVEGMSWRTALAIGVFQCLAMIPGVSRSGATIMGALGMGVDRKTAAEFSFFLAVPTMLAASVLDLIKSHDSLGEAGWSAIAIGFVVSFVVALLVIRWFLAIVTRHGFAPFAWYRIAIGGIALVWLLA
ncbi:undecaprenyl-diphosphate phosphatase [Stakelama tenebrarum]|uniref:Undecaprenyl-diphosphatase n=1 Tax=Stakelama tenebrarum TaxID=2711215 RepID=A0A6G6Y2H7_9SPHN|nr:undecaprenyl-diphosphate phosphatase [Sphingosinithalassobacter tenebrarum]QIG78776.1 undecaprenyl-diphosphate phosphatase [Sphingosinithalassobacter tenebrarum]